MGNGPVNFPYEKMKYTMHQHHPDNTEILSTSVRSEVCSNCFLSMCVCVCVCVCVYARALA